MSLSPNDEHVSFVSTLDKEGVGEFMSETAQIQKGFGRKVTIYTTGGTKTELEKPQFGIGEFVHEVKDFTEVDEGLGGGVKTINHRIAAALLARAGVPEDDKYVSDIGARPINMLVFNFYDFKKAVEAFEKSAMTVEDFAKVMENIDVGGPSNMRAALKRGGASLIIRPDRYESVLADMRQNEGRVSPALDAQLGLDLMEVSSIYEAQILAFLKKYSALHIEYRANIELIRQGKRPPFEAWRSH